MTPSLEPLLASIRRRLRMVWALATAQVIAPAVALVALLLVLAGRFLPWSWPEHAALAVVVAAALLIVAFATASRIPDLVVAKAADRGLSTKDAFSTSLELHDSDNLFTDRVHERAAVLARHATADAAVPIPFYRRHVVTAAVLGPAAVVLALIANPQDRLREQREADEAAIEATSDVIRAEAERIAAAPEGSAAAERLQRLADELAQAEDVTEAEELLSQAEAELRSEVSDDLLAKKAASEGLARSLENAPLPGASSQQSAQEQMESMAESLSGMNAEQLEAAAERLEALAESLEAGDPATAEALNEAAEALRNGDVAAAQARLGEAAAASASNDAAVAGEAAAGEAAEAAADAGERLGDNRNGDRAQGGKGNGKGDGDGDGDGKGNGNGNGNGSGNGQGSGSGSPSGNVNGGGNGTQGQGGQGQGTGTKGPTPGEVPDVGTVFDPPDFGEGETGSVGGGDGSGEGGTIGKTDGQTNGGQSRVPVDENIDEYAREATEAMDNVEIPPSVRDVVLGYFDQLQGRN
jgi:hypothetical protein